MGGAELEATVSEPGYLMVDFDTVACVFKDLKSGECRNALPLCVSNGKQADILPCVMKSPDSKKKQRPGNSLCLKAPRA